MKRKALYLLGILTLFIPLGLISQSPAWGEWERDYYEKILGFVPKGIENSNSFKSPIPDYSIGSIGDTPSYYISALIGVVTIFIFLFIMYRGFKSVN
jgi:hypothetical protein